MKQKQHYSYISDIGAVVFLAVLLSMFIVLSTCFIRFTGVLDVAEHGDSIFGININRTRNELFMLDKKTGEGQFLKISQLGPKGVTIFPDVEIDDDGSVYVIRERYGQGTEVEMKLMHWDITRNRLELVKDIPLEREMILVDFEVHDNEFYFLFSILDEYGFWSETAYILDSDGHFTTAESTDIMKWDNNLAGVSLSSLHYQGVRLRTSSILLRIAIGTVLIILAEVLIILLIVWLRLRDRRISLTLRLAAGTVFAFLILTTVGNFLLRWYMYDFVTKNEIYACSVETQLMSRVLDDAAMDDLVTGRTDPLTATFEKDAGSNRHMHTAVAWFSGGQLVILGDLFHRGELLTRVSDGSLIDFALEAYGTDTPKGDVYAGTKGVHALVFYPLTLDTGNRVLLCAQTSMYSILYKVWNIRHSINRAFILVMIAILAVTVLLLHGVLSPIKDLRKAVAELAAGNLKARAPERGHNELTYAAREFNRLAEELENKREGADVYRRFYEAFLPIELLRRITGRRFSASLEPGTSVAARVVTLVLRIPGDPDGAENAVVLRPGTAVSAAGGAAGLAGGGQSSDAAVSVSDGSAKGDAENHLENVSGLLSDLTMIATENGGVVTAFGERSLTAEFTGTEKEALLCALLMQRKAAEAMGRHVSMGIAAGGTEVDVAGSETRKGMLVREPEIAGLLARLSEEFGDAAIVTSQVREAVKKSGIGFHFRCLGRIEADGYCPESPFYELLDAEMPEIRRKRQLGCRRFEAGADAYAGGDYFRARNEMVSCLAADPDDRAARCYCINCDRKEPPAVCQAEIRKT